MTHLENKYLMYRELILDVDKKTCNIENNLIYLTKYEFELLKYFLENQDKIFSRQELINKIWTKKVTIRAIDTTISRLRKKIQGYGKYIHTRPRFGYGWIN